MKKLLIILFLFFVSTSVVKAKTTGETIVVYKDGTFELVKGKGEYLSSLEDGDYYTQPNFIYELHEETYQNKQWYLDGSAGIQYTAALKELGGIELSEIIVAVLDTGVDYTHLDLKDMMWNGKDCVSDTGGKLGGCIHGYSYAYGGSSKNPMPGSGEGSYHGTHVAGIIGAAVNGTGIAGVAQNVKIMAVRADSGAGLETVDLVRGIAFARQNGAKVINASWGSGCGKREDMDDRLLKSEIAKFPGIFVVSAGNGDRYGRPCNHDSNFTVPSSYRSSLENIVVVAASDSSDRLASFSDYGGKTVDVAAPGKEIFSTVPGNKFAFLDGTSMAAPVVVGIVGAIWGINPKAETSIVAKIIRDTVDVPSYISGKVMYGRVNLLSAVKKAKSVMSLPIVTNTPVPTATSTTTPTPSCPVCKAIGDYSCNGVVDGLDYSWWKQEFVDKIQHGGKWTASSTCKETISSDDFSAWRINYLK